MDAPRRPRADVAVAVCTRDGARFVEEQLRSIAAQSVLPGAVAVRDDASSDGTVKVVAALAASGDWPADVAMTVTVNRPALGVAGNFSAALGDVGSAAYVALSDQDDVWHPDRLRVALEAFAEHPDALLVATDARLVDAGGAPLGTTLQEALEVRPAERAELAGVDGYRALLRRNVVTGATTMVRRELVERALPVPDGWLHDEWLAMVAALTGRVVLLADVTVDYRQHGANEVGARKLGLRGKVGRLGEPRAERNRRLLARASSLVTGIDRLGDLAPAAALGLARAKLAHELRRSALPASRLRRIPGVVGGLLSGDYRRFGGGLRDAVRDLVQPA